MNGTDYLAVLEYTPISANGWKIFTLKKMYGIRSININLTFLSIFQMLIEMACSGDQNSITFMLRILVILIRRWLFGCDCPMPLEPGKAQEAIFGATG